VNEAFKFGGLSPGIYDIYAVRSPQNFFSVKAFIDSATGNQSFVPIYIDKFPLLTAKATLEVRDEDIKDVRLVLERGVDVLGHLKVADGDGKALPLDLKSGIAGPIDVTMGSHVIQVRLNLRSKDAPHKGLIVPTLTKVTDNSFTFSDVPAGVYGLAVVTNSSDPKFYVADIREGARSIFDDGLQVTHQPIDSLEVILSFDGGGVTGNVLGTTKSSVLLVLAPPPSRRKNRELFKTITLEDASKPFNLSGVAPGLYSLLAFELSSVDDTLPYLDTNFLSQHEHQGVPVTVEKGAVAGPLRVPLIPR
jgi:hypothetical protein